MLLALYHRYNNIMYHRCQVVTRLCRPGFDSNMHIILVALLLRLHTYYVETGLKETK